MKLRTKFNLAMIGVFAVGMGLAAVVTYVIARDNSRHGVLQNARIMLEAASAVRSYTSDEIEPILNRMKSDTFDPHTIPSFAAKANLARLRSEFPNYVYNETALNPTNLADRPNDWQSDIIATFRQNPGLKEIVTERDAAGEQTMNLARPLRVSGEQCLQCHSVPRNAPPAMLAAYGSNNGFGWKVNEIIGAQIVTVPLNVALERADQLTLLFAAGLGLVFAVMLLVLNLLLHHLIVKPVRQISAMASAVSLGQTDVPEYVVPGHDEIASLSTSFNRMRRSLSNAMAMLDTPDER